MNVKQPMVIFVSLNVADSLF